MNGQAQPRPTAKNGNDRDSHDWQRSERIRLLLVDDDELFQEFLAMNLAEEQFNVATCENGRACLALLETDRRFDLILLDWRMPDMTGIEVMQELRAAGIGVPVVFLTAFASERNEGAAFDCGAVDFLDKSRSGAVLARRIRVLVRRGRKVAVEAAGQPDVLQLGRLAVHFRISRAYWHGEMVPLTTTEFRVVQLLASRAGDDVSYRAIYDVVHGRGFIAGDGSDGYRTNVRSLIKRIRQKFVEIDGGFDAISNYPGFGYRWQRPPEARPHRPLVSPVESKRRQIPDDRSEHSPAALHQPAGRTANGAPASLQPRRDDGNGQGNVEPQ